MLNNQYHLMIERTIIDQSGKSKYLSERNKPFPMKNILNGSCVVEITNENSISSEEDAKELIKETEKLLKAYEEMARDLSAVFLGFKRDESEFHEFSEFFYPALKKKYALEENYMLAKSQGTDVTLKMEKNGIEIQLLIGGFFREDGGYDIVDISSLYKSLIKLLDQFAKLKKKC